MNLYLIKQKSSTKKGQPWYKLTAVERDGNDKAQFNNITGKNGNQLLGFVNAKSGHIQILEGNGNRGPNKTTDFAHMIDKLPVIGETQGE